MAEKNLEVKNAATKLKIAIRETSYNFKKFMTGKSSFGEEIIKFFDCY